MNPSSRLTRRPWLLIAALGIGVTTLFGSGLFAAVVDAAPSSGNGAESGAFTGTRNLQLELVPPQVDTCPSSGFADAVGPATVGTADLDGGTLTMSEFKKICVRVVRGGPFRLTLVLSNVVDSETGCSTKREAESGFDPTCGGNAVGELSKVLRLGGAIQPTANDSSVDPGCSRAVPTTSFDKLILEKGGTPALICKAFPVGSYVTFLPEVTIDPAATDDALAAAQTDKVQFNFSFRIER